MDRLTEMEAFTRVVELGGFTDAARKVGLSKSAVSKHVTSLESRLGTSHPSSGNHWRVRSKSGDERPVRSGGRLTINNGEALVQAALDGVDICLSPNFICYDKIADGSLVEVLPEQRPSPPGVYAVYPAGRFPQPKLSVFIDHLAAYLKGRGPRW